MELSEELQERVDIIRHKLKFVEQKPTVTCITALQPLQFGGADIARLLTMAGADNVADIQQNPDIIILMPDEQTIEQTMRGVVGLLQIPGFADLKAAKNNRLYIADAATYFENAPQNYVDSTELLAELIYPKQFIFGHEGEGWVKFEV